MRLRLSLKPKYTGCLCYNTQFYLQNAKIHLDMLGLYLTLYIYADTLVIEDVIIFSFIEF
jgi:hypothetical protein